MKLRILNYADPSKAEVKKERQPKTQSVEKKENLLLSLLKNKKRSRISRRSYIGIDHNSQYQDSL